MPFSKKMAKLFSMSNDLKIITFIIYVYYMVNTKKKYMC